MYFGFQFLYVVAAVLYVAAFFASSFKKSGELALSAVAAGQPGQAQAAAPRA